MIHKYRIKITEKWETSKNKNSYLRHFCKVYINEPPRKSRKHYGSFTFIGESYHKELIDLQKVADGKMPVSLAILHVNSENPNVKELAKMLIE
jgi:hypothetical protein